MIKLFLFIDFIIKSNEKCVSVWCWCNDCGASLSPVIIDHTAKRWATHSILDHIGLLQYPIIFAISALLSVVVHSLISRFVLSSGRGWKVALIVLSFCGQPPTNSNKWKCFIHQLMISYWHFCIIQEFYNYTWLNIDSTRAIREAILSPKCIDTCNM